MRTLLLSAAAALAACQQTSLVNNSAEQATAPAEDGALAGANSATVDGGPVEPDQPVSSDDPPSPVRPAEPGRPTSDCPIVRSSGWQAHVNAMPGPNDNPRLIVRGDVTVPTGGYTLGLRMGPVAESYPVQVTVRLIATPPDGPATQALETREVRGSFRSEERVGSVTVRCGNRVLARISPVETAH